MAAEPETHQTFVNDKHNLSAMCWNSCTCTGLGQFVKYISFLMGHSCADIGYCYLAVHFRSLCHATMRPSLIFQGRSYIPCKHFRHVQPVGQGSHHSKRLLDLNYHKLPNSPIGIYNFEHELSLSEQRTKMAQGKPRATSKATGDQSPRMTKPKRPREPSRPRRGKRPRQPTKAKEGEGYENPTTAQGTTKSKPTASRAAEGKRTQPQAEDKQRNAQEQDR